MIEISIPGKPIAKKRPRFFRRGNFVGTYNDQATEEGRFQLMVMDQLPENFKPYERDVALSLHCVFAMPIPKSTSKKKRLEMIEGKIQPTKKPDTDNLIKFVKDCCNSLIWHDDCQIVRIQADKLYGREPRTEFYVTKL